MKIVAIANAHALAHVSRLLEISKVLREHGHEIVFAGFGKFLQIAHEAGFATEELPYISIEQIIAAVRSQKLNQLYCLPELEKFIDAEIAIFKCINPDLVLIDNRPTARTSADYCGIKTVAVLNVHMSSYRKLPFFSLGEYIKLLRCLDPIETKIECLYYDRFVMKDLNQIRKKMGLKRYFGNQHEEGDLSLLADIPEFNPASQLPENVQYIGPLVWHNNFPPPTCLTKLDSRRKTIYFSLGSASLQDLLQHLAPLIESDVQLVVAYGKLDEAATKIKLPDFVYLEEYINADLLLPHCDAVCCHGGNGTIYQALEHGLPVFAIATHAEQYMGAKRLQQLGLGKGMHLTDLKAIGYNALPTLLHDILDNEAMRFNCQAFSVKIKNWNSVLNASRAIDKFI